jgi:hypothetical protein
VILITFGCIKRRELTRNKKWSTRLFGVNH